MKSRPAAPLFAILCAALAGASVPSGSLAHVVLSVPEAAAGGYYAGAFRVSHGCAGSPTVALRIEPPAETPVVKPQPKPGWTLSIEKERLATPLQGEGGPITERVKSITWRGRLSDDMYDEFGVSIRMPNRDGPLYLPAIQTCAKGEARWVEIPEAGRPAPANAAPRLTLKSPDPMAGHTH